MTNNAAIQPGDQLGFIGLGHMGTPMTQRLLSAGYRVVGFDQNPAASSELDDVATFTRAGSLQGVVDGSRAVILMLPNSSIIEKVLIDGGLLAAMNDGDMIIDMSSSQPTRTLEMAKAAADSDVRFIDVPVSGGVPAARDGSLTLMAGGQAEWIEEFRPALEQIGKTMVIAGDVGAGHALKAINNMLSASTLMASSEALVMGVRFGLDPVVMTDAINVSSGRSWSSLTKWPRYILPRTFDSGFLLSLLAKDTRIAIEIARDSGIPVPHGEKTLELWEQALAELGDTADHTDIHRWVEKRAGFETPKATPTSTP
jgi:3-hydroxyisobutyrate dehydrogenase